MIIFHGADLSHSVSALEHQTSHSAEVGVRLEAAKVEQQVRSTETQVSSLDAQVQGTDRPLRSFRVPAPRRTSLLLLCVALIALRRCIYLALIICSGTRPTGRAA